MTRKAMVIDLARCAGCHACVVACQMQNNTRSGVTWGKVDRVEWGEYPDAGRSYLPHACMQCDTPACVEACPTGASFTREDGITLVDYEQCICCEQCVAACPYDARHVNNSSAYWFDQVSAAPYEAHGIQREDVVEKCIFCAEVVDAGGQPACVANCPGGARFFGDLDEEGSIIAQKASVAVRIDQTGFYLIPVAGQSEEILHDTVAPPKSVPSAGRKAGGNVTPVLVGAGVLTAAAVGAGVGYFGHKAHVKAKTQNSLSSASQDNSAEEKSNQDSSINGGK